MTHEPDIFVFSDFLNLALICVRVCIESHNFNKNSEKRKRSDKKDVLTAVHWTPNVLPKKTKKKKKKSNNASESFKYCRSFSVEHCRYTSYAHYLDATFFKTSWFTEMKDEVYRYGNLCLWISTAPLILCLNLTAFEALIEENCLPFSSLLCVVFGIL